MREQVEPVIYTSDDQSIPISNRKVRFPICAFLEKTLTAEDEIKAIALVKKDKYGHYKKNATLFQDELMKANLSGAKIDYTVIDTDFQETRLVYEQLMGKIVEKISIGSHILVDSTYGPKDMPIIVFTALNFAEKFLDCTVDNIIYGQASFFEGQVVDTKICDMMPLYCLAVLTNTIQCTDPEKAKSMLKALLSL